MKRYGNLYQQVYDMNNLRLAHKNASTGKGWYGEVQQVNTDVEGYLEFLQELLITKAYQTSEYSKFTKRDGKKERLIYKLPYFPDRICQWALMQVIEPIFIKNFIADTYSAIPGRGVHMVLNKIKTATREDPVGTRYCLKLDIKKFYPSIKHHILKNKFRKLFKDPDILWLLDEIVDSVPEEEGIPIGNYVSQYCGNFYLSEFDHWIKETEFCLAGKTRRIKYYYRYMDDIVILSDSKEFLHSLRVLIDYEMSKLGLTLKSNWQVFPIKARGIDFIGYRVFPDYVLLRKDNVKTMKRKTNYIMNKVRNGGKLTYHDYCSVNSYSGWILPCDSYRLKRKYVDRLLPYCDEYWATYLMSRRKRKKGDRRENYPKRSKHARETTVLVRPIPRVRAIKAGTHHYERDGRRRGSRVYC